MSEGKKLTPYATIHETREEASARRRRNAETDGLVATVERERARFSSATSFLAWVFSMAGHMESPPAIDPSADVVQGARVDRDERIAWVGAGRQVLTALVAAQGHTAGLHLLWLHLRPRVVTGYREKRGIRIPIARESIPLWELHAAPGVKLSRRGAVRAYWEALRWVEDFAYTRGWIAARAEKKPRAPNVYRREAPSEEKPSAS